MTFLAGPPNKGRGQVVKLHRVLSESQEKTAPLPDYEADLRRQNTPEEPAQPSTELGNGQPEVYEVSRMPILRHALFALLYCKERIAD